MAFPDMPASSNEARRRTVEGSCWACKRRRVKCDLQKPSCRRCTLAGTEDCSYDKLLLRWKKRPSKSVPDSLQQLAIDRVLNGSPLAINERRAIDYFKARLWPLFSTADQLCPTPVALALRSQPVLQALCVFAEEHRALQERGQSRKTLENRRLHCLTAIRGQLGDEPGEGSSLSALLVAVLLLYFLEGYVNCTKDDASTRCHYAGALAIIDALGGFHSAWASSDKMTRMLLSEFASTDLTDALLQDRRPYVSAADWQHMESGSVWWESTRGTKSLAEVFSTMAEMSFYLHDIQDGVDVCSDKIQDFERALQPSYSMLDHSSEKSADGQVEGEPYDSVSTASLSLNRAFQHAGLIYLYSAILNIPTKHFLVQQHVRACLECIQGIDTTSRVQNCALFPLYVAGAHSLDTAPRTCVLDRLDIIYTNLRFQSVLSVRSALEHIWQPSRDSDTWSNIFKNAAISTLVI
jgi:hypothetical protein